MSLPGRKHGVCKCISSPSAEQTGNLKLSCKLAFCMVGDPCGLLTSAESILDKWIIGFVSNGLLVSCLKS